MRRALRILLRLVKAGLMTLVFLAGAVVIGLLSLWLTVNRHFEQSEVVVPSVVGLRVDEAARQLSAVELELHVEARRPSDTLEPGLIFFQEPLPQARTRRHRRVRVYLSTGPRRTQVPRLTGQSGRAALLTLGQEGLSTGEVMRVHAPRTATNAVIAQDPVAGARVGNHERVDLLVSMGPWRPAFVMPNFEGRSIAEVELTLSRAGLRLAEVSQQSIPGVPGGRVASQVPEPGSRVSSETAIRIVVARSVETPVAQDFYSRPRFSVE